MPKMSLALVPEATTQLELTTQQTVKLRKALRQHAMLAAKIKALKAEQEKETERVTDVMNELGAPAMEFEGFKTKYVQGHRKTFDKDKFVRMGGKLATYNKALVEKPTKGYTKITAPGEKGDDGDE